MNIAYSLHADHPVLKRVDAYNLNEKGLDILKSELKELNYENIVVDDSKEIKTDTKVIEVLIPDNDSKDKFITIGYINHISQINSFHQYFTFPLFIKNLLPLDGKPEYVKLKGLLQ